MKLNDRTDAYSSALAEELRRRREEAGLSKNRLAEMAGLSQQMVSYVEKSVCIPTTATLYRLAEALGTTPGVILSAVDGATVRPGKNRGAASIGSASKEDKRLPPVAEDPTAKTKAKSQKKTDHERAGKGPAVPRES